MKEGEREKRERREVGRKEGTMTEGHSSIMIMCHEPEIVINPII